MEFPNTALFERSLTVDNKRVLNYLLRWIMLILIGFSMLQFLFNSLISAQVTAPGLGFFEYITTLNLIFITILGVTLFSSVITEEKEVGSLGLLLMTGLSSFSLLISKSTSKMIVGMMLVLAQLPFSIMAITLGGVSMHQVLAVYMTLFTYIFFISNLALFFSVITSRTYKAATWTLLSILLFHIASIFYPAVAQFSPFSMVWHILQTGFTGEIIPPQIVIIWVLSLSLFIASVYIFNYFTRINTNNGPARTPLSRKKGRLHIFPVPRAWHNAIAWKEFFFTSGGIPGVLSIMTLLAILIGAEIYYTNIHSLLTLKDIGIMLFATSSLFFALQAIYLSSTIFNHELEAKTFSTLIMLPLSLKEIAYSKIRGGVLFLIPSFITLLAGIFLGTDFFCSIPTELLSLTTITLILTGIIQFIFYLYLVTFFSLKIRYGGFVLAAVVFFIIQIAFGIPSMMVGMLSALPFGFLGNVVGDIFTVITSIMTAALYVFAIIFTHRLIAKRLLMLAGE